MPIKVKKMKFTNRETEFPGKRKLIKVDEYNVPIPGETPIIVNIIKDEGRIDNEGTPITADNLNEGNWRDDNSVSFKQKDDDVLPEANVAETQIVTLANGEVWIIPPAVPEQAAIKVISSLGTAIKINGLVQKEISFTDDPQDQITNARNIADTANNTAETAQGTANSRSTVNVSGVRTDVNFTSDPQTQINGKASASHAAAHTTGADQIPLGNGTTKGLSLNDYNAADRSKVSNLPSNTSDALLGKLDKNNPSGNAGDVLVLDANKNIVPVTMGGGITKTGGSVAMNVTTDKGKTVLFNSAVTGITITGSSAAPGSAGYIDDETRYIFTTGSSAVNPTFSNIDYKFPESPVFKANTKYMVALFGRVLTFSEGV